MHEIRWEIPDETGTTVALKFSELGEFQNHLETLGHCLNVKIFEITSVHIHATLFLFYKNIVFPAQAEYS